jgi:hypothetical protein
MVNQRTARAMREVLSSWPRLTSDIPSNLVEPGPPRKNVPFRRESDPMEACDVKVHLRRWGVVVHHVAKMPSGPEGRPSLVVFLEGTLGQFDLAHRCALRIPGVVSVTFSGHTRAIMYVHGRRQNASRDGRISSRALSS